MLDFDFFRGFRAVYCVRTYLTHAEGSIQPKVGMCIFYRLYSVQLVGGTKTFFFLERTKAEAPQYSQE